MKQKNFIKFWKRKPFTLLFQPIVDLRTGQIAGYEALSRIDREETSLTIDQMFQIAERVGCVWKLEKTIRSDIENYEILQKIMKHYVDQGYEIAMDDVGAGYSGLNRVVNTMPNYLKADMELVRNIEASKAKKIMMELLLHYCDKMGFILIAEGIETAEELNFLCNLGVHYGQGYFLGIPERGFQDIRPEIKKI